MNPMNPPMVFVAQQPAARPWLSWLFAAVMAVLAANGGKLPTLPALPQFPFVPPAPPAVVPPTPLPPGPGMNPPAAPANPSNAICRIQFGTAGCTAAPLNLSRTDGRFVFLTAAHCVSAVGSKGVAVFKDGRRVAVSVVSLDRQSDCALLLTDEPHHNLPTVKLAERSPAPSARVWHAGYGVDKPTNREDGERLDVTTASGMIGFKMSVSSGDSGGPIFEAATGEVVSCVCCTQARGQVSTMFGASTERIRALLARMPTSDESAPAELPIIEPQ